MTDLGLIIIELRALAYRLEHAEEKPEVAKRLFEQISKLENIRCPLAQTNSVLKVKEYGD